MGSFTLHIFLSSIESETRLYKEAAYTLNQGICSRVVVLGLWDIGLKKDEVTDYQLEIKRITTIVRKLRSTFIHRVRFLRIIISILSIFQYALSCIIKSRILKPDHISCHNAMMLPVAWLAAKISGATLEYLPHELEIERAGLDGFMKKLTAFIENLFIKSARNVVVVCDPIKDWYVKTYDLKNIYVVRNTPEREAVKVKNLPDGEQFRTKFNIPKTSKIYIYQGQFGFGRGIEFLIEAFSEIDSSICHLVLMGFAEGDYQSLIDKAVEENVNIHFQPAVSRGMIVSYSACADIGILISDNKSLSYIYSLPNKFFEYAHAGLPILVSKNFQYQASILEKEGFGWSIGLDELKETILTTANSDLSSFQDKAINYASNGFWETDAVIFSKIYKPKI